MEAPWDENAEIRAMILLALPYPPLPVRCLRCVVGESTLGEEATITTHDVISRLLEDALNRKTPTAHKEREQRQQKVCIDFMRELVDICGQREIQPEELYQLYCRFTSAHIATFFDDQNSSPPLEIQRMDSVQVGDNVHKRVADFMAGQAILLGDKDSTHELWKNTPLPEMLLQCKERLVNEKPS